MLANNLVQIEKDLQQIVDMLLLKIYVKILTNEWNEP